MLQTLRTQIQKHKNALFFLAFAGLAYSLIIIIVREKLDDVQTVIQMQITKQQTLLTAIAETTARNGADDVTESIVRDCDVNERTEFDSLLVQLDKGLSLTQLTKLDRLFGRCATFYPQRKSVMVARLSREVEVYSSYVDQLKTVSTKEVIESYKVSTWQELVVQEQKQSELFATLVGQQEKIIDTLISGKNPQSEEIKSVLKSVEQTQIALVQTNQEAASTRKALMPL
jgi:hypothetical protein